jgi:hypothetical protein
LISLEDVRCKEEEKKAEEDEEKEQQRSLKPEPKTERQQRENGVRVLQNTKSMRGYKFR